MNAESDEPCSAAALLNDGQADAGALLADTARRQRRAGRQVRGLVMTHPESERGCAGAMVLLDLHTADEYLVSQQLGAGSASCNADPQGFARASQVLRRALDERPDLVVCNRFGRLEAEGGGFRAELLALIAAGIPVLTVVSPPHAEAWQSCTGGAPLLPARRVDIDAWLGSVFARPRQG